MTTDGEKCNHWMQEGLQALYEKRRHCDITIHVHKEAFHCHKVVLAAVSGYFDAMFGSSMVESRSDTVSISDIHSDTFRDLLQYIYGRREILNADNVELLLHASNCLQIHPLRNHCEEFLLKQLSDENCVGFWVTGLTYACEKLETASFRYIIQNFDQVVNFDEYLSLEFDQFVRVIRCDSLQSSSEEIVCRAALDWIMHDESSRKPTFQDILQELRLCQVSLEFLLDEMFTHRLTNCNELCTNLLKDAIKYHSLPERRHLYDTYIARPRQSSAEVNLTVVLGKRYSQIATNSTECIAWSQRDNKWFSIPQPPFDLEYDFATCPFGNDFYISGGTSKSDCMFHFSSKHFRWTEKAIMKHGRYRHRMLPIKRSIFVVGGYNFGTVSNVEEYNISDNSWEIVGSLQHAVDAFSAANIGERIYVFGGWTGFLEETTAIQCYDTVTNTCTDIGHLPSPQKNIQSLVYDTKIYLAFTNGEIYTFKPESMIKLVHKIDKFGRNNFGMLIDNAALYLLGGSAENEDTDESKTCLLEHINCIPVGDTHARTLPNKLPVTMEVYGCFRTVIRQKYPLVEVKEILEYMG